MAPGLTLLTCPLEIRHEIYGLVCEREGGSDNLLRDWFGNRELKEIAANAAANPTAQLTTTDGDEDNEDEEDENEDDGGDEEEEDGDEEMDEDATADGTTTATTTAPTRPQISRKWRHVPGIMSLSACPPPLNLLHTCKQLHEEAIDFFYDTAILRINCTSGFNHMAYFEDLMNALASTAFSPAESVRKVQLTFVWDSQWIRASDIFADIFTALLRERARLVARVLTQTPALKNITVVWHDSVKDAASEGLRDDVMEEFYKFMDHVELKMEEHYDLEPGEEPGEETVLGKMRLELEEVATAFKEGRAF